ncbi:hypothetical protein LEP1GSC086_0058 [Leptospira weilii str. LNT 1234]|nr:hypothetical protein LEP1GSC086_0058 [Leptospira weilii str. LNT 1234]
MELEKQNEYITRTHEKNIVISLFQNLECQIFFKKSQQF